MIVHSDAPVTLIGGAEVRQQDITTALNFAPRLVAADGGAVTALKAGLTPEAVIGDMDSISSAAINAFTEQMHRIEEQSSTDFDKALRNISAPLVIALGVSGGRFDHELAAIHVLLRHSDRPCVVLGAESLIFLCPPEISMNLPEGMPFSLFPFGKVRVISEGLRWATADVAFSPESRIGTSNAVIGPVALSADRPLMMVILPREALEEVVVVLSNIRPDHRWPNPHQ